MDAAIEAPSPWVKKWDDQLYEVVYHHPERNETVSTVANAKLRDRELAMDAAIEAPSPWVKKWDDQLYEVVYHHPQRNETIATVDAAKGNDALAIAQAPPTSWIKHWDHDASKVVYVNIERNVTVLTVGEAVASDHAALLALTLAMYEEAQEKLLSPVSKATEILAHLESPTGPPTMVVSNPNSNIDGAVLLLREYCGDVAPTACPDCVVHSGKNLSQVDQKWLEFDTQQQTIKEIVSSGSSVDDELIKSRDNLRVDLVKDAAAFVSMFHNSSTLISKIEVDVISFLQSLQAWISISDDHVSDVAPPTTTTTTIDTDHTVGVVKAALTSVDEHHADAMEQHQHVQEEIRHLMEEFYSTHKRAGSDSALGLFSTIPTTLKSLFDIILTQETLSNQVQEHFPEAEVRSAVATLCKHLQEIVLTIQNLREYVVYCEDIVDIYTPWLTEVPDVKELTKSSKAIRKAKRSYENAKLDEEDAIADDKADGTNNAEDAIVVRLRALKALHSTRHEQDTLISRLLREKQDHFPELDLGEVIGGSIKEMFFSLRSQGMVSDRFLLNRDCTTFKVLSTEGNHTVYQAEFPDSPPCALKHYLLTDAKSVRTFRREVGLLHRLQHPNIVKLSKIHLDETGTGAYIEMPLYNGGTLATWLAAEERSPELLRSVLHQLLQAVHHLHTHHVIHCDIHPSNIFMHQDAETGTWTLFLGDFDVSLDVAGRTKGQKSATAFGGRDDFMAPELRPPRNEKATSAADIYAVGLLLKAISDKIDSPNFKTFVEAMLNDSPQQRPSAHTLLQNPYFINEQAQVQARLDKEAAALAKATSDIENERLAHVAAAEQLARDTAALHASKRKVEKERAEVATRSTSTKQAAAKLEADRKRITQQMQASTKKEQDLVVRAREAEVLKTKLKEDKKRLSRMMMHLTVPPYWLHKDLTVHHTSLHATHFMIPKLQTLLRSTPQHRSGCSGRPSLANATVTKVFRNENTLLWNLFGNKRAEMRQRSRGQAITAIQIPDHEVLDASLNEVYLFHGTTPDIATLISRHGFDERVASMNGLYGAGTYFAENSCKSMQYTMSPNSNGEYTIIYSRVLLGHAHHTSQGMKGVRRAPDRVPGVPFDSVVASGGNQVHREFIVYDRPQTYPEFIIYFKP